MPSIPPVSITIKSKPAILACPYLRSRVSPGKSATNASRVRVKRLNNVDFPTLGLPTRAITGVIYPVLLLNLFATAKLAYYILNPIKWRALSLKPENFSW